MASQLGSNIINFFENGSRGANAGKNDNGVEIEWVLLSVEINGFDAAVINTANSNGYNRRGLDSLSDRVSSVRDGFSYFRGVASTGPPGSLPFADRRRIVVVDATDPANLVVRHNAPPLSSGALNTTITNDIRAAINLAAPPPVGTDYSSWAGGFSFPAAEADPGDDPDRDGWVNLFEFHAGTDPLSSSSRPPTSFVRNGSGFIYTYQRAIDRVGVAHQLQAGPLGALSEYVPDPGDVLTVGAGPGLEEVTVHLPLGFGPYLRQSVNLTP